MGKACFIIVFIKDIHQFKIRFLNTLAAFPILPKMKKDSTKKAEETFFFLLSIENQVHKSAESLLLFKIGSIFQR